MKKALQLAYFLLCTLLFCGEMSLAKSLTCAELYRERWPQLHPQPWSPAKVIGIEKRPEGIYYETNGRRIIHNNLGIYEIMGFDEKSASGNALLPAPETINYRLRQSGFTSVVKFVGHYELGWIPQIEYLRYVANGQMVIGMKGQAFHDMVDHAPGFLFMSQTKVWPKIISLAQDVLKNINSDQHSKAASMVFKINSFLEGSTTGMLSAKEAGEQEFLKYVETLDRQIESYRRSFYGGEK